MRCKWQLLVLLSFTLSCQEKELFNDSTANEAALGSANELTGKQEVWLINDSFADYQKGVGSGYMGDLDSTERSKNPEFKFYKMVANDRSLLTGTKRNNQTSLRLSGPLIPPPPAPPAEYYSPIIKSGASVGYFAKSNCGSLCGIGYLNLRKAYPIGVIPFSNEAPLMLMFGYFTYNGYNYMFRNYPVCPLPGTGNFPTFFSSYTVEAFRVGYTNPVTGPPVWNETTITKDGEIIRGGTICVANCGLPTGGGKWTTGTIKVTSLGYSNERFKIVGSLTVDNVTVPIDLDYIRKNWN